MHISKRAEICACLRIQIPALLSGWIGIVVVLFLIGSTGPVWAEIQNKSGRFDSISACPAYEIFLEGKPVSEVGSCQQLVAFLISSQSLDPMTFLSSYIERVGRKSGAGWLASVVKAAIFGDAKTAFYRANWADRQVFTSMSQAQDFERAALYSSLVSNIRTLAVRSLCGAANVCKSLALESSVEDVLGSEFSSFDKMRPDIVLLCLLKTDGFVVPVRSVLRSTRFTGCLEDISGE